MTAFVRAQALTRAAQAFLRTLAQTSAKRGARQAPAVQGSLLSSGRRVAGIENRCPVCQARFRGLRVCSRCGADLEPPMLLTVKSWRLREASRQALDAGNADRALRLCLLAQRVQETDRGEALRLLCTWLKTAGIGKSG